jgi:peptidoglycan/LPS O-acetylase OafA/YrhL
MKGLCFMNMPQHPDFDMKSSRQYPNYDHASIPQGTISTGQRIMQSFNSKVIIWAALAIFGTWAFLMNPRILSLGNNLLEARLLFASGVLLGICDGILLQRRRASSQSPIWLRIIVAIAMLVALFIVAYFLGNNSLFFSLGEGLIVGAGACYAIAAYLSNWASYS